MVYLDDIITGLLVFPIIAAAITIPYALFHYHRYGSVSKYRTLIIYSFILYMLIAYFMVILPLPDRDTTIAYTWHDHLNLIPFRQIWLYWHGKAFTMTEIAAYLKSMALWQLLFNVLLTVPFGIYLRYYFKQDLKHTIIYTFFLSLFFEVTQITGLYFIYPGPYRLADVEDLITNTLGGVFGYYIAYVFTLVLPSRDEIDQRSRIKGQTVSGKRRFWAVLFDSMLSSAVFTFILGIAAQLIPGGEDLAAYGPAYFWTFFVIVSLLQVLITRGTTLGHAICRMTLVTKDGTPATAWQLIKRYLILWLLTELPPTIIRLLPGRLFDSPVYDIAILLLYFMSRVYFLIYIINEVFRKGGRPMSHDKLSGTVYMATAIPEKKAKGRKKLPPEAEGGPGEEG